MSADRSGCWCADKRQPCSYHEGWGDAEDVCAVEIDGLSAELAATERAVKIAAAVDAEVEWCRAAGWGADEWNNGIDAHNDLLARLRAAGES